MTDIPKRHIFDNPKNVRRVRYALYIVCALSLAAEIFIHRHVALSLAAEIFIHRHVDHPWEALPGFYSLYGFAACVILVLVAKELRKLLMRGEDYYDG
jgi:hypothetical protein